LTTKVKRTGSSHKPLIFNEKNPKTHDGKMKKTDQTVARLLIILVTLECWARDNSQRRN